MKFKCHALLPMESNSAIIGGKTVKCTSVALPFTTNHENFLADVLLKRR
jgi:hypothetical protein